MCCYIVSRTRSVELRNRRNKRALWPLPSFAPSKQPPRPSLARNLSTNVAGVKMSGTDIEMEGSGQDRRDSGSKLVDSTSGEEGKKIECDVPATSNGIDGLDKPSNEIEENAGVDSPVKDEISPEIEANEQTECTDHEQLIPENEKAIDMNSDNEEEAASKKVLQNIFECEMNDPSGNAAADDDLKKAGNELDEEMIGSKSEEISKNLSDCVETPEGEVKTEKIFDEENSKLPSDLSAPQIENGVQHDIIHAKEEVEMAVDSDGSKLVQEDKKGQPAPAVYSSCGTDDSAKPDETTANSIGDSSGAEQREASTPKPVVNMNHSKAGDHSVETVKSVYTPSALPLVGEGDDGTPEDQEVFLKEVESFYRERSMDFKQPKFYGQPLNCLKLWRSVIRLGGYDKVTGSKLWRLVGESFHPPKTCTTVSWTFRIFYEKSLLEFERHKVQTGELQLPVAAFPEASGVEGEGSGYQASGAGSGSGRAKRDSAARAMQVWHAQRLLTNGEAGEPIAKDKIVNSVAKHEKNIKTTGSLKQKRPPEVELSNKAARTETSNQLATSVVDVGPPADWVKINIRQAQDCFEVYALVPGLLREEVRVQSDPAGRVVITGQPEQVDNPWGVTPFKKVVSLPKRIDPLQTSAVVSMHGRLFVRVPFEQSNS